jgi:hypothetical protein
VRQSQSESSADSLTGILMTARKGARNRQKCQCRNRLQNAYQRLGRSGGHWLPSNGSGTGTRRSSTYPIYLTTMPAFGGEGVRRLDFINPGLSDSVHLLRVRPAFLGPRLTESKFSRRENVFEQDPPPPTECIGPPARLRRRFFSNVYKSDVSRFLTRNSMIAFKGGR